MLTDPQLRSQVDQLWEMRWSHLNTAGRNGQFRTPRHIIRLMVQMIAPEQQRFLQEHAFQGYDNDSGMTMLRIGSMNMMLHGSTATIPISTRSVSPAVPSLKRNRPRCARKSCAYRER